MFQDRLEQKREGWLDEGHRGRFMAGKVGIPEKRVVALRLAGASWDEVNSDARRGARLSWFRRTGCLMAVDGSEDHWIQPQGLVGYQPPPPGTWEAEWDESEPEDESEEEKEKGEEGNDEDADWDLQFLLPRLY